jgi:hypothetical protein
MTATVATRIEAAVAAAAAVTATSKTFTTLDMCSRRI